MNEKHSLVQQTLCVLTLCRTVYRRESGACINTAICRNLLATEIQYRLLVESFLYFQMISLSNTCLTRESLFEVEIELFGGRSTESAVNLVVKRTPRPH